MEYVLILLRSLMAFAILFVFIRLRGETQISQLSPIDFVIGITIGSIASAASVETDNPSLQTAFGIVVWTGLAALLAVASLHSPSLSHLVHGTPVVLVEGGRIARDRLHKHHMTVEQLMVQLRKKGVFDLREVEAAVLETDGTVSVLKRSQQQPVTPEDLGLDTPYRGLPTILIVDGRVQQENLAALGEQTDWLRQQLQKMGISDLSEVMYASIDTNGELYVDAGRRQEERER